MIRAENPPAYLERLRDEFAMAALPGFQNWTLEYPEQFSALAKGRPQAALMAEMSYEMADAMLAARQGGGHE